MTAIAPWLTALALLGAPAPPADDPPAKDESFKADPSWKPLGKDLWFDRKANRVVLRARVSLQDGILEHLVSKGKDHESVLVTDAPPRMIKAGLILTGAKEGHPVRFQPTFEPPTGQAVAIEVEWEQGGKLKKADARDWVKDLGTGKPLAKDWVFAGSETFDDPRTKATIFAADDGDLITVANFPGSILDLPYRSSASDVDRGYASNPDRVPPRGTPVTVYLSPRNDPPAPDPKDKAKPAK